MKKHFSLCILSLLVFSYACFGGGEPSQTTQVLPVQVQNNQAEECPICTLSLSEMKPIKKTPAFFVSMRCCKQNLCIDCCTKVAGCPFCRTSLETNPKHTFRTMVRILSDYDLEKISCKINMYRALETFMLDYIKAKEVGSRFITPQGRQLSEYEEQVAHMMIICDDATKYFTSKLAGLEKPFSYTLSKDERSLLKAVAQKEVKDRLKKKRAQELFFELLAEISQIIEAPLE